MTSLHLAVIHNSIETLSILIDIAEPFIQHSNVILESVDENNADNDDNDNKIRKQNAKGKASSNNPKFIDTKDGLLHWTPLQWACYKKHNDIALILIDSMANIIDEPIIHSPLHLSSYQNLHIVADELISKGAKPNSPSLIMKQTPLKVCCQSLRVNN